MNMKPNGNVHVHVDVVDNVVQFCQRSLPFTTLHFTPLHTLFGGQRFPVSTFASPGHHILNTFGGVDLLVLSLQLVVGKCYWYCYYYATMTHHADYSNFNTSVSREESLETLLLSYNSLAESQTNWVANLANCSSLLYHCYKDNGVNWAGFYLVDPENSNQLILGPFMGKVACQTIQIGKGVCGNAAKLLITQLVPNVENYPGHIACDGDTKSEIVLPIIQNDKLIGVLDLDCINLNGFTNVDKFYLEKLCNDISKTCKF